MCSETKNEAINVIIHHKILLGFNMHIYSLSENLKELNSNLINIIKIVTLDDLALSISNDEHGTVLFTQDDLPDMLKLSSYDSAKNSRFICIGKDLNAEDRLVLLNNNIEFIAPDKFARLSDLFFKVDPYIQKHKVLLVEDDESQIMITEHILENADIEVKSISKGEEVLDALTSFKPDLVLMDLYLEGITGDKLVKVIRKVPKFRFIPIVFLTADTTESSRMQVLNAGADDLLTKPINAKLLVAALKNRMQRSILYQSNASQSDSVAHDVGESENQLLNNFLNTNNSNNEASIIWIKVNNQQGLLKKLGYSGFKNLCKNLYNSLPSYDNNFIMKLELLDGVFAFGSENLNRVNSQIWLEKILKWLTKNYFSINGNDYHLNITSIILADIPKKKKMENLVRKAENILIDSETKQSINFLDEGSEDKQFYFTKRQIEESIKSRNFKWLYQSIIATKDESQEIYQLALQILTKSGENLATKEYYDVAEKSNLLGVLDRFTLEHAIRVIRLGEQKGHKTIALTNQTFSNFESKQLRNKNLTTINKLKLPHGSLIFQFNMKNAQEKISLLPEIARDFNNVGIGVCLSHFDCSTIAWKIARKLHTKWVRLSPQTKAKEFDSETFESLKKTINKAHTLGYKVIVSKVDSAKLAADLWKLNIDYLQGDFIQAPTKKY